MTTAYITDARVQVHTLAGHIENAERLAAVQQRIANEPIYEQLLKLTPEPISDAHILSVHTQEYLNLLKWTEQQNGVQLGADTYALPESLSAARLACGMALRAVDAICSGEAENALVAVRPPGHHAVPDMAMGFCLLANVAIAARYAQAQYGVQRILIVDYDVHHGNGTQEIFYEDGSVYFCSTHQSPWYPGTGLLQETGAGKGKGTTLNLPLPAGVGDSGFKRLYAEVLWPAARRFRPHLMIVSAGFDAHWRDPLGGLQLTLSGYAHLSRELIRMAAELCDGKIIFVQEGGYDHEALSCGMLNVAYALLGLETVYDPIGAAPRSEPSIEDLIRRAKAIHQLD
ncbi:MAG: histone deacetylase [Candidatus Thermofonsia Clade 1 bacterium]|jgi:acetoin utilization deacetylase AcuC-like enzyme|uniref:Histone deacetylase n=1 Tax=Candidatus Thermofonsia Clade 1 bacterium TaxID=2364210 RepID=A0A2M8PER4_9CHLR|nr:MAG: histone deacetylase [Candidatus Thermofonsia Clade 1 bacterium]RMF54117.1 MAG: histone deacetylase [Chloroflexota bacterium]